MGGGNGFGFGGGGRGDYATQADLAAGFNNSAVLNKLNDITVGQANAINYNNQGFSGLNTSLLQGFHGVPAAGIIAAVAPHVDADAALGRQIGVQGVPFFVFDGKLAVSGAQPAEVFAQALEQAAAEG